MSFLTTLRPPLFLCALAATFLLVPGRAVQAQNPTVTTVHDFISAEAVEAHSGLILGPDGNFYGTSGNGGASSFGTVYKITPAGVVTVLHSFNSTDGSNP